MTEAAAKLSCTAVDVLSRLLNGRTGISPGMALERIGWSNAAFWVRHPAAGPATWAFAAAVRGPTALEADRGAGAGESAG